MVPFISICIRKDTPTQSYRVMKWILQINIIHNLHKISMRKVICFEGLYHRAGNGGTSIFGMFTVMISTFALNLKKNSTTGG